MRAKTTTFKIASLSFAAILAATTALASGASHESGGGDAHKGKKAPARREVTTLKSWIDVEPFTVSVIQGQGVRGTFMVAFGLDVPDDVLRTKAEAILPRLRNNWLLAMNKYASTRLQPKTQADIVAVKARLQRVTDDTLGQPGAKLLMSNAIVLIQE